MIQEKKMSSSMTKTIMLFLGGLILLMSIIFGVQVFGSYQSTKKTASESKLSISALKNPENENQLLVTVTVEGNDSNITGYSFDGGKSWQVSNRYIATNNDTLDIRVKDYSGKVIGQTEYEVETVDLEGPILTVSLPTEIEQNTIVDLLSYAKAQDASRLKGQVTVTPNVLDTSIIGKQHITYRAVDSFNNESVVTVEVNVVSKKAGTEVTPTTPPTPNSNGETKPSGNSGNTSSSTKKIEYRYRTKTISNYECDFYDCSYVDYTDVVAATVSFGSESYCCTGENCKKINPQIKYPCPNPMDYCSHAMVPLYTSEGNICYSRTYIYPKVETSSTTASDGGRYEVTEFNSSPKTECDSNEIKIGRYCHTIDSKGAYICPNGYVQEGSSCVKLKQQTCSKTCVSESWGPWSDWSYTKVIESDTVQVQTR